MRKIIWGAVTFAALGSSVAQAQLTTCNRYGYGSYSCYTQEPNNGASGGPLGAFLNGYIEGREARLRMEQLRLQNELLRRRLQSGQ
jgi:hypothetical protein